MKPGRSDGLPGVVIASGDAVFPVLCGRLLAPSERVTLLASVPFDKALEAARRHEPDFILLDIDSCEHEEARQLTAKLALVSEAKLVIASGYLAPGSPDLNHLLQHIACVPVLKPSGGASLSLAGADGEAFLAALEASFEYLRGETGR